MRRIPLSRRSHIVGFQPIATGLVEHESALERDFITLTSFLDSPVSIISQPITLTFQDGAVARRYTPDFMVRWSSRRTELIEVKYQADLDANIERLMPAFAAARAWSDQIGAVFRIVTEREIRRPVLENAKRLLPLRRAPIDSKMAVRVLTVAASRTPPTFGRIVDAFPGNRALALATLWRLIARGELHVDLAAPISMHSPVRVP